MLVGLRSIYQGWLKKWGWFSDQSLTASGVELFVTVVGGWDSPLGNWFLRTAYWITGHYDYLKQTERLYWHFNIAVTLPTKRTCMLLVAFIPIISYCFCEFHEALSCLIEFVFVILLGWSFNIIIKSEFPTTAREILTHNSLPQTVFFNEPTSGW